MKICIVSSCGGHLAEVRQLRTVYEQFDWFYVLNDRILLSQDMEGRTYFIRHSERDWKVLINIWEAWKIIQREQPDVFISTGAGPIVPFAILARMFRRKVLFIETVTRVHAPSLTGRIMYYLADVFLYQWESLSGHYPKGRFIGLLF